MPSVLITGANRGLRLEFVRQYAADGWQIYASYRDLSSASKLRRLANTSEDNVRIMALDVTDPLECMAVTKLEGHAIDLLLNNAGVGGARGFQRRLLALWHAASASSSSPLRAVWDQLPTILLAAQSTRVARFSRERRKAAKPSGPD